jgi:hypothetical protein
MCSIFGEADSLKVEIRCSSTLAQLVALKYILKLNILRLRLDSYRFLIDSFQKRPFTSSPSKRRGAESRLVSASKKVLIS